MAGVAVNPNFTISPDLNNKYYYPGGSFGVGANLGVYLGKRLFLFTGIEETKVLFFAKGSYTISSQPSPAPYSYKNTSVFSSWEIPLLANYMLTNKSKRVSFFLTLGFLAGRYISIKYNHVVNEVDYISLEKGREIRKPNLDVLLVGAGCKINLNKKYSLFIIPDYRTVYTGRVAEIRTMLVYNF